MRNACKHLVIKNKLLGSQHFDANQMEDLIPMRKGARARKWDLQSVATALA
jgi:hypothetical protein